MNEDEANVAVKVEKEEENTAKWTNSMVVLQNERRQNETQN